MSRGSKEFVYLPIREMGNMRIVLPALKRVCLLAGCSLPRFEFYAEDLEQEIRLNAERIEKITAASGLSEKLWQPCVDLLEAISGMMESVREMLSCGMRADKKSIIRELRQQGALLKKGKFHFPDPSSE